MAVPRTLCKFFRDGDAGINQAFQLPVDAVGTAALAGAVIWGDAKFPHEVGQRFPQYKPGFASASRLGDKPI